MVVSSPVGDVKVVSPISPFVLNTLKLKLSAFFNHLGFKERNRISINKNTKRKESVVVNDNTKRVNVSKFIVPEILA